jgi:hypothetical protein
MSNTIPETPTAAVEAWWQAMQNQDLGALKGLTVPWQMRRPSANAVLYSSDRVAASSIPYYES